MNMRCFACNVVEPADFFTLSCCKVCRNVLYCSKVCQRENQKEHKNICKSLITRASGYMQVKQSDRTSPCAVIATIVETTVRTGDSRDEDFTQFIKLFQESEPGGRRAAAREMKQITLRQGEQHMSTWIFFSIFKLVRGNVERLQWSSNPLLVLFECMDPTTSSEDNIHAVSLTWLTELLYLDRHRTNVSQLFLARQLVRHGGTMPLHTACGSDVVTNLELVHLLLQGGADPNARNLVGVTPLMCAIKWAHGAATDS